MSFFTDTIRNAFERRQRLFNPINAVPDTAINLRRKPETPPRTITVLPPMPSKIQADIAQAVATLSRLRRISIRKVQRVVCADYKISISQMNSPVRTANLVRPRQVAMYLCRSVLKKSYPEIGRGFAGRDHTTALSGIRKVERMMQIDAELAERIIRLEAVLSVQKEMA